MKRLSSKRPSAAPKVPPAKSANRREPARLIIASSEESADLLYATKFAVGDPIIFLVQDGRSTILLSDLEIDRGKREAEVDEIVSISEYTQANKKTLGRKPTFAKLTAHFLQSRKVRKALVPTYFPLGLSRDLAKAGLRLDTPKGGAFYPERVHKKPEELNHLRRALEITVAGLTRATEVLAAAKASRGDNELKWGGSVLTSERLRAEIESAILRVGGVPKNTIVAGGDQACDPHERGSGPLRANELIILDVFPRDGTTGYFGDMTRTVVKGRASDAQRHLWETVQQGQRMGIERAKAGANGEKIHEDIKQFFKDQGYPTELRDGRNVGFFHGTGHGLGLEIHEAPRYNHTRKMEAGCVFTVEPGLYYPGLGGVRIEDVVVVTKKGTELLSHYEQRLEI